MTLNQLYKFFIAVLIVIANFPALACAVCYTDNGLSGASIALIVIVSSFLILFFSNKVLKKIINKD
tara:strand:- start:6 stop:203 length:198 start_codon:yes stop_codon:yes gene_type:complete